MAQRGGICYDPLHVGPTVFSAETIANDMIQIKANGFTHVRTFESTYGNGIEMGPLITQAGLIAALSVRLQGETQEESHHQLMSAVEAAKTGNAAYIFIGNENLAHQDSVPQQMLEYIQYAKANVPSHVLVGTVQRNTEFLDPNRRNLTGFDNLLNQSQIVGVNVHPFFSPNLDFNDAINNVRDQWNAVVANYGSVAHKLALTEVGWPSGGINDDVGGNYGSVQAAERFYSDFASWSMPLAQDRTYYFQMYDQPYKGEFGGPVFETKFGLFTANGTQKFSLPPVQAAAVQQGSSALIPASTPAAPAGEGNTERDVGPPSSTSPTSPPTKTPTSSPTAFPTKTLATPPPSMSPTSPPTKTPTTSPTASPTSPPSSTSPTPPPIKMPTISPTASPTKSLMKTQTKTPTGGSTSSPLPTTGHQIFSIPGPGCEISSTIQTSAATGATCVSKRVIIFGVVVCVAVLIAAGSFC